MNNILKILNFTDNHKRLLKSSKKSSNAQINKLIAFSRDELNQILTLYGRKVVSGEWKDYAIDTLKDQAIFSVYRKTNEIPQFIIIKIPKLKHSNGIYQIKGQNGRILKRSSDLSVILKILEKDIRRYKVV
jgi:hypothetical protein